MGRISFCETETRLHLKEVLMNSPTKSDPRDAATIARHDKLGELLFHGVAAALGGRASQAALSSPTKYRLEISLSLSLHVVNFTANISTEDKVVVLVFDGVGGGLYAGGGQMWGSIWLDYTPAQLTGTEAHWEINGAGDAANLNFTTMNNKHIGSGAAAGMALSTGICAGKGHFRKLG